MANIDAPRGFTALQGQGGTPRLKKYRAGTATDIFRGDVVAINSSGILHSIATTTGSAKIVGVAATAVDASASSANQDVWVWDDPDQQFIGQDDGTGVTTSTVRNAVGSTFPFIVAAGNTLTGQSIFEIDGSATGVSSTDPVIVQGYLEGPKNEVGPNATWIFTLNRHIYKKGSVGI
jgi:hypothetical protein